MKQISFSFFFIILFIIYSSSLLADEVKILDIQKVPDLQQLSRSGAGLGEYDGMGMLDAMEADHLVIDDRIIYLNKNVVFESSEGGSLTYSQFKPGTTVFYYLDGRGKINRLIMDRTGAP